MRWHFVVSLGVVACGDVSEMKVDAPGKRDAPIDMAMPDTPAPPAASCKAIHTANPALPSGTYMIDPDGTGADAALSVTCDMSVDGGGWTIIFFPPSENSDDQALAYTTSTPRLLTDATQALIAYRSATQVAYTNYASFDLPADWKTATPFAATATDVTIGVSVNGAALANHQLRYGKSNFPNLCTDAWNTASVYGRICIAGTAAPYLSGFAAATVDQCSASNGNYNATACSNDLRFSIAVR